MEHAEGRRPHDPSDIRGGGGPAGSPERWPTSRRQLGPLRSQEESSGPPAHSQSHPDPSEEEHHQA